LDSRRPAANVPSRKCGQELAARRRRYILRQPTGLKNTKHIREWRSTTTALCRKIVAMPFITFEGSEGCGKSTQMKRLATPLEKEGIAAVVLREPGVRPSAKRFGIYSSIPKKITA